MHNIKKFLLRQKFFIKNNSRRLEKDVSAKKLFKKFISFHELSLNSVTTNASGQLAVDNGSNRHSLLSKPMKVVAPIKHCLML